MFFYLSSYDRFGFMIASKQDKGHISRKKDGIMTNEGQKDLSVQKILSIFAVPK